MFHRNMQGWASGPWRARNHYVAFDLRHFERYTGFATLAWAKACGGIYGDCLTEMFWLPYLVPAVGKGPDYFKPFLLKPKRGGGLMPQLGSGLSPVAPVQKILMLAVYAYWYVREFGASYEDAIANLVHQTDNFRVHNFGDDNFVEGLTTRQRDSLERHLSSLFPVEIEDPPGFLGFLYNEKLGWHLSTTKAVINWTLNERMPGSRFRPYPEHGWRARRAIFESIGHPDCREFFKEMDDYYMPKWGVTTEVRQQAYVAEKLRALRDKGTLPTVWKLALEKQYLLTPEEKARMPETYSVLDRSYAVEVLHATLPGAQYVR
jgi:hypothetical protein